MAETPIKNQESEMSSFWSGQNLAKNTQLETLSERPELTVPIKNKSPGPKSHPNFWQKSEFM